MKDILLVVLFLGVCQVLSAQCDPDKVPPLLVPKGNIQVALGGPKCVVAVSPEAFLTTVSDNCFPLPKLKLGVRRAGTGWGFPMPGRPLQLTALDLASPVIVEVWARDSVGNSAFVYSSATVTNPAGCVFELLPDTICTLMVNGNGLEDLTWALETTNPPPPANIYTIDNCVSLSADLLTGAYVNHYYKVTPYKDNDPLNGVSTYDGVLMLKHILEWELLGNPYRIIAADVDRSGSITVNDLIELRKLILGIYTELPDNTSWRFVPADYEFPYPNNPFYGSIPGSVEFDINRKTPLPDMVPIKVGDVNYNAISNSLTPVADRSAAVLRIQDALPAVGETLSIPVYLDGTPAPAGLQFALRFDPAVLEIAGIQPGALPDMSEENYFQPEPGLLTVSWINPKPAVAAGEMPAFYLIVRILQETTLQEAIALKPDRLAAELYASTGEPVAMSLHFLALPAPAATRIGYPYPNPGSGDLHIPLELAHAGDVRIELHAADGRILTTWREDLMAGRHRLTLPVAGPDRYSGVLVYKIWADGVLQQGKLLRY